MRKSLVAIFMLFGFFITSEAISSEWAFIDLSTANREITLMKKDIFRDKNDIVVFSVTKVNVNQRLPYDTVDVMYMANCRARYGMAVHRVHFLNGTIYGKPENFKSDPTPFGRDEIYNLVCINHKFLEVDAIRGWELRDLYNLKPGLRKTLEELQ